MTEQMDSICLFPNSSPPPKPHVLHTQTPEWHGKVKSPHVCAGLVADRGGWRVCQGGPSGWSERCDREGLSGAGGAEQNHRATSGMGCTATRNPGGAESAGDRCILTRLRVETDSLSQCLLAAYSMALVVLKIRDTAVNESVFP